MATRHTDELIRIAAAGGGFTFDAATRPTEDLVRIAAAAGRKGARIGLRGLSVRPIEDIVRIASAGKGAVHFEEF